MPQQTLTACLEHWANEQPDTNWLSDLKADGSTDYTWGESRRQINAAGAALEKRFGQDVKMLLLSPNRAHWILADMAIIASGNVTVPLFTTHPQATAEYIADFTDSKAIFVGDSPNWEAVRDVLPEGAIIIALPGVELAGEHLRWEDLVAEGDGKAPTYTAKPSDVVSLVFTSGTTGMPKGVIQTHESNLIPIARSEEALGKWECPRYFSYLPLAHLAERQIVEFSSLYTGGEIFFNESLEVMARDLARTKPVVFFGAPRVWEQLQQAVLANFGGQDALDAALAHDAEGVGKQLLDALGLDRVEFCLTASAPTPPPLIHWWHALGLPLVEGFGQTEAMGLILSGGENIRIGSVGKPVPGVECKLTDEDELIVRAQGLTPGYYKNPEKTAELLRDGWLHTGDKARVDDDGFLYITGRVKDYFKTIHGKFVAPPPIEGNFADNIHVEQRCLMGRGLSKTVMAAVLTEAALSETREEVEASVRETIAAINRHVEKHARIGAVILSSEAWTIENDILTPTLKIRREKIEERFGELAAKLARESAEQSQLLVHWL